jgi:hypothetical protein
MIPPITISSRLSTAPAKVVQECPTGGMSMRGGEQSLTSLTEMKESPGLAGQLLAAWGVLGVLMLTGNAIRRLMPIALQPFYTGDLSAPQWALYAGWALFMAYAEGYKGFHQKFSPLVVKRAFTLDKNRSILNVIFAWAYSMGLFFATRKRMIVSWSISAGVMALVMLVKNLAHPWRSIVDGGVVLGLTLGSLSIVYHYIRAIFGKLPDIDACLVANNEDSTAATNKKRTD